MDKTYLHKLLEGVANGEQTPSQAVNILKNLPYEDLGFANIDNHRALRTGNTEVVFCQGKTSEQIAAIMERMAETSSNIIGTRASVENFERVKEKIPEATYEEEARMIFLKREDIPKSATTICIVSAGTADIPIAEEAALTAEFYGNKVDRIYDVGVAGIHRLLDKVDRLRQAKVIIVVAGMEGALTSVVGGLVDKPVVGVPTSIGYGASLEGLAPLMAMLNSCSLGVSVMNIDNGFGAGYLASMINRL